MLRQDVQGDFVTKAFQSVYLTENVLVVVVVVVLVVAVAVVMVVAAAVAVAVSSVL
jgi:hypothetical protein